jgi:Flp pilus assembly protein TadG
MSKVAVRFASHSAVKRAARGASLLLRDAGGVAAIEFAFMAPVLLLMLLGTIEVGRAVNIDRHFTMATQMAGELVAREQWMGTSTSNAEANLDSIMKAIKHIMYPYNTADLKLGVFSVLASMDDASKTKVDWSYSYNGMSVPSKCQNYSLPPGMVAKGGGAVVVEASYGYKPIFAGFVPGFSKPLTWTDRSFHSPRMDRCVSYTKPNGNSCLSSC